MSVFEHVRVVSYSARGFSVSQVPMKQTLIPDFVQAILQKFRHWHGCPVVSGLPVVRCQKHFLIRCLHFSSSEGGAVKPQCTLGLAADKPVLNWSCTT